MNLGARILTSALIGLLAFYIACEAGVPAWRSVPAWKPGDAADIGGLVALTTPRDELRKMGEA